MLHTTSKCCANYLVRWIRWLFLPWVSVCSHWVQPIYSTGCSNIAWVTCIFIGPFIVLLCGWAIHELSELTDLSFSLWQVGKIKLWSTTFWTELEELIPPSQPLGREDSCCWNILTGKVVTLAEVLQRLKQRGDYGCLRYCIVYIMYT